MQSAVKDLYFATFYSKYNELIIINYTSVQTLAK